ncbi:cysteine dioxygenase family protein [Catenulispora yoronensis]|uniref:Cysteine dioxygenase family protein n=1 Tax=Catenulispora yoronensis TaxID=450799 RepID=A0ABN2VDK0_9ACTN
MPATAPFEAAPSDITLPELDLAEPFLHDLVQPGRPLWTPTQLRDLTRTLAQDHAERLRELVRYTEPQRWWTRLALTRGVEVWLLSWLPGQGTHPHDHGGAAGSFTVLTGEVLEEHRYPGAPIGTRTLHVGQGLGFGGDRAHVVRNAGVLPAATVHAYSPPLLPTREYTSLEEVV